MAKVQTIEGFSVAPDGRQNYVEGPAPSSAIPKQLQGAGDAISSVGAQAADIYTRRLRETNQLRVDEAINAAKAAQNDLTFDKDKGWSFIRGRDTLDRESGLSLAEEYGGKYEAELAKIEGSLGNGAQRDAFAVAKGNLAAGFRGDINKHTAREYETWATSVKQGQIDTLTDDIALHYDDPERVGRAIDGIRGAMYDLAKLSGKDRGAYLEIAIKTQVSKAHTLAISTMIEHEDISAAEKYTNLHKDEMTPEDLFKVDVAVGREQDVQLATEAATDYISQMTGHNAVAAPQDTVMPVTGGRVTSAFGVPREGHNHGGIDIAIPTGSKVAAAADGKVSFAGRQGKYGNMVEVKHPDGSVTRYAHLQSVDVAVGDQVGRGQVIARSGGAKGAEGAGNSTGPHLHYEMRVNGQPVDPTQRRTVQRGGTQMTLEDAVLALRSDPRLVGHSTRMAEAERQIRSVYGAGQATEAQNKQDAVNAAYTALVQNGGDFKKLSPAIRGALPGEALPGVISFASSLQNKVEPSSGSPLWAYTKDDIAAGRVKDMAGLIRLRPQLSDSDFKDLAGDITSIRGGKPEKIDSIKTSQEGLRYIETELAGIGIDITPTKESTPEDIKRLGDFKARYYQAINAAEGSKGKPLTGDEARQIGLGVIASAVTIKDGWFSSPKTVVNKGAWVPYESIPGSVKASIVADLRAAGINPTRKQVAEVYAQRMNNAR